MEIKEFNINKILFKILFILIIDASCSDKIDEKITIINKKINKNDIGLLDIIFEDNCNCLVSNPVLILNNKDQSIIKNKIIDFEDKRGMMDRVLYFVFFYSQYREKKKTEENIPTKEKILYLFFLPNTKNIPTKEELKLIITYHIKKKDCNMIILRTNDKTSSPEIIKKIFDITKERNNKEFTIYAFQK